MRIETLVVGDFQTNTYIVTVCDPEYVLVVDAPSPAGPVITRLNDECVQPDLLVITHAHIDHIAGLEDIGRAFPAMPVAAGAAAAAQLGHPAMNLSLYFGLARKFRRVDRVLAQGERLQCGAVVIRVLLVEGHAPGSVCLLAEGPPPVVFSGDTLFAGDIGRTDLPGGDSAVLIKAITAEIMSLPDETVVYPGHGPSTTVGDERANGFLK